MKKILLLLLLAGWVAQPLCAARVKPGFIAVRGMDLVDGNGDRFFIRGTNLGHWLNPEGYMFGFESKKCGSPWMINQMFSQLVGPEFTAQFWRRFRENFITREDIAFIAKTGSNTIRLPLHYKLFTDEDYLGVYTKQDGFDIIDKVISWCRAEGIYVILDMHDAPGGSAGIWVDDSYGYPWLFESPGLQQQLCDIWQAIAARYKDEPAVLGYDLLNEPIFNVNNTGSLNPQLEKVYKKVVQAIRKVDTNHIVILGGAHCNSKFEGVFTDWKYDGKLMWECHHYGGKPVIDPILKYIAWRDKTGLPMYMGEIGHNSFEWIGTFRRILEENNIGWTFWTYKHISKRGDGFVTLALPQGWDAIRTFANSPRGTYDEIRDARPDQAAARRAMEDYLEAIKFEHCKPSGEYLDALGLKTP